MPLPNTYPIYLDYNATTPVAKEVVDAMQPYWNEMYGNPSSSHRQGRLAREAVERARQQVADLLGVSPSWVIFTGCATEANNLALLGTARARPTDKRHLIISEIEHPAIAEPAKVLQREGWTVSFAPVDTHGVIRLDAFERLLRPDTALVSLMHANNEIGTIQPIADIARLTKPRGIVLHTDAAQSVGKMNVLLAELGVDMLTLAGHKFHAPKGVGALVRDPAIAIMPLDHGAGHESGLRPGTENVPLIVGLGAAAKLASETLEQRVRHLQTMRDRLHGLLQYWIPGLQLNGHPEHRLPNTLNVSFPDCDARAILAQLADTVAASAGSACHSDSKSVSGVLGAIGASAGRAAGAIRLSVGMGTTEEDIDQAAHHLTASWKGNRSTGG
jgi:cysteine desulfurase